MRHIDMTVHTVAQSPSGPLPGGLPSQVVDVAKYWCTLAGGTAPRWGQFKMTALGEAMSHVTVLHKLEDGRFAFEFCGAAVAALLGQDLAGETLTTSDGTRAEIDWAGRVKPVLTDGECHLQSGVADPQYTLPI